MGGARRTLEPSSEERGQIGVHAELGMNTIVPATLFYTLDTSTAPLEMLISSSVEATDTEILPHHSSNPGLIRREFRQHGPSQVTA